MTTLAELKKSTLASYVKKAVDPRSEKSVSNLASRGGYEFGSNPHDSSAGEKEDKKAVVRSKGIARAATRLAKEGYEIAKPISSSLKEAIESVMEAKKKIGEYTNGNHTAKVYKLSGEHYEGDPYVVKLHKDGKHYEPADYFTNDEEDAHGTAKIMVKESLDEAAKNPWKKYEENEDNNEHSVNVLHMAKHVGDEKDIATAKEIVSRHKKERSMYGDNMENRNTLDKKLYPIFKAKYGPK